MSTSVLCKNEVFFLYIFFLTVFILYIVITNERCHRSCGQWQLCKRAKKKKKNENNYTVVTTAGVYNVWDLEGVLTDLSIERIVWCKKKKKTLTNAKKKYQDTT